MTTLAQSAPPLPFSIVLGCWAGRTVVLWRWWKWLQQRMWSVLIVNTGLLLWWNDIQLIGDNKLYVLLTDSRKSYHQWAYPGQEAFLSHFWKLLACWWSPALAKSVLLDDNAPQIRPTKQRLLNFYGSPLSGDGSNSVTLREWRYACRIYGFNSGASSLFKQLDGEGMGSLSLEQAWTMWGDGNGVQAESQRRWKMHIHKYICTINI